MSEVVQGIVVVEDAFEVIKACDRTDLTDEQRAELNEGDPE